MLKMFLEMALYAAGFAIAAYLFYTLFFSKRSAEQALQQRELRRKRFERREAERGERRQQRLGPPESGERRKAPRRDRD